MNRFTVVFGFILACAIAFTVGLLFTTGSPNQLIVNVTTVPDTTAQAAVNEQLSEISTYTSGDMATGIAKQIEEQLYVADATRAVEFQTVIAGDKWEVYQHVKSQLIAEGVTFVETPTPIQTIGSGK